jgi:hypothetical protein
MRMPGLRLRVGLALAVIAASSAWLMRPLDRSVLIPLSSASPKEFEYINLQGRVVREPRTSESTQRWDAAMSAESLRHFEYFRGASASYWIDQLPRIRGYADANGQLKHRIAWEKLPEIDLVPIRQGKLWGYMNRANTWVVDPTYKFADVFHPDGIAVVSQDGKLGAINRSGKLVVPCEYDSIYFGTDRGVTYVKSGDRNQDKFVWINRINRWMNQCFGTKLPALLGEVSIYDSEGNFISRNVWLFRSWASVWILLASVWIAIEVGVRFFRRRRLPAESPDLSSAARTH